MNRTWSGPGGISRFGRDNVGQATHTVYGPPRNQPAVGTPSQPGYDGKPRVTPVVDPTRNDAAEARRQRVENSRRNDAQRDHTRRAEPRQSDARPQEVKPDRQDRGNQDRGSQDRGSEGRRADPVRSGQRDRQAERARRFDAMPEARQVQPEQVRPEQVRPEQGRRDFQPRSYQPAPESRQYQPPQREQPRRLSRRSANISRLSGSSRGPSRARLPRPGRRAVTPGPPRPTRGGSASNRCSRNEEGAPKLAPLLLARPIAQPRACRCA